MSDRRKGYTSLTRTPATFERCEGTGVKVDETRPFWGNTVCPVCHGIARLNEDGTVAEHEVRVLGDDEQED